MNKYTHEITWINNNNGQSDCNTKIGILKDSLIMENRCAPYYKIDENDITDHSKLIQNSNIISVYRNPRGGDFIIYSDGMISDIHYENKIGKIKNLL